MAKLPGPEESIRGGRSVCFPPQRIPSLQVDPGPAAMVLTFHQHTPGALSPCHASAAPQGKSNCDIGMSRLKEEGAVAAPAGSNGGFSSADNAYSERCKKGVSFR